MRLVLLFFMFCFSCICSAQRIGIVGAGIGGTTTAYFLRELLGENVQIDVYESNKVGGRLATVEIDGNFYETGGSIIHPKNRYMTHFAELFDLKKRILECNDPCGLYKKDHFVFTENSYSFVSVLKFLWRYGLSAAKVQSLTDELVERFDSIYNLQLLRSQSFTHVGDLLHSVHPKLSDYLSVSSYKRMKADGLNDRIIEEFVSAVLTCNYGQTPTVQSFVGYVSLAGARNDLWSVEGGNKQVPIHLLNASKPDNIYLNQVMQISRRHNNKITIIDSEAERPYDVVVVATPITTDQKHQISFTNFTQPISVRGAYKKIYSTIIKGIINHKYFGVESESELPAQILSTEPINFNSVSRIYPVSGSNVCGLKGVWKVFSENEFSDESAKKMFFDYEIVTSVDWLAYPLYESLSRNDSFVLDTNLFYVNAIEWAASAMEMSCIGGRNAALLVQKALGLDTTNDTTEKRDEL